MFFFATAISNLPNWRCIAKPGNPVTGLDIAYVVRVLQSLKLELLLALLEPARILLSRQGNMIVVQNHFPIHLMAGFLVHFACELQPLLELSRTLHFM